MIFNFQNFLLFQIFCNFSGRIRAKWLASGLPDQPILLRQIPQEQRVRRGVVGRGLETAIQHVLPEGGTQPNAAGMGLRSKKKKEKKKWQ